jgi:glycosyltransferase involved in cell wall biosynthesis
MPPSPPLVSIGLPVYNGERYIREAIESVLAQTLGDLELIICDNASTDATQSICREYAVRDPRVRYVRNEVNMGAARNFNLAFELAQGPYFKWIAADDAIEPRFLEQTVGRLEEDRLAVAAGTGYLIRNEFDGTVVEPGYDHDFEAAQPWKRLRKFFEQPVGSEHPVWSVMRVPALRETGLFRDFIGADFFLVASLLLLGPVRQVPKPLNCLRVHDAAYSWRLRRENAGRDNMQGTAEANWWNPERSQSTIRFPQWRLLAEYAHLFAGAPEPLLERGRMLRLLVYPYGRRSAVILTKELAFALGLGGTFIAVRDARRRVRRPARQAGVDLRRARGS